MYKKNANAPRVWGWTVLLVSTSTLLCCALPILLVSLGMGAVFVSLTTNVPFLMAISENKVWTFTVSAIILLIAWSVLFLRNRTCPADPNLAKLCNGTRQWNLRFFWAAVVIWCIGFFSSFILPLFRS